MAAYASLVTLMRVIHDVEHHPYPPISLDKQLLDSITQRIMFFQEFLQSYISPVFEDDEEEVADPLEMRIAGAAHAAEDAIEYHIVDCINQKRNKKANDDEKIKSINRCCRILRSVIKEMDSIKKVLVDTQKPLVVHDQVAMKNVPVASVVAQSETFVGSDAVLLEIMERLAGGKLVIQVIPIVGMGGIGKTFLAKTIYTKPFIKERFDICAWATISQHYDTEQILCELLSQATNTKKEQLIGKGVDELGLELHKYLFSRRFLIVMDDMWSIDSWDKIQHFFPNNYNGSRVLVTTRLTQLSLQLNNDYSFCMSFLDEANSWDLFSKTVFGENNCPPELKNIGEKIVDICRGLPLSIAVVGGLLKKMDCTRASWESIRDNFTSVVNMKNGKNCLTLLKLSYNHLPVHLKPCFLYMGVFEEDEEIRVATLVQLWVSEGFLKPINGEALETTARGFLQDLIDRNLILIGELGTTGSLRFCKMHDLVRDMCLKECQKEGFYHFIGKCNPPLQGMNSQRRVVIPKNTSIENVRDDLRHMSHTRSIHCKHDKVALCRNLVLLRTLQAQNRSGIFIYDINLNSLVCRYVNLRHIAISAPRMWSFLPSVSRLWNLQTLIVYYNPSYRTILATDFWEMSQFRHFEFVVAYVGLPDPPNFDDDAVVIMENLHTLKGINNFKCSEGVVKRIPNIKRLKLVYVAVYNDVAVDDAHLLGSMKYMFRSEYDDDDDDDDDDGGDGFGSDVDYDAYHVGNIKYLCKLEFLSVEFWYRAPFNLTAKITFPQSLKKLNIWIDEKFEWGDMLEKIGSLPLLEKLKLLNGCFEKAEWEIAEGKFPSLKYLNLRVCTGLENWTASEKDSSIFPRLEHLCLGGMRDLNKIPSELGNIDTLKSIKLINCGEGLVMSAKEMFDEQVDLQGGEDQLCFHVVVDVREEQRHLLSLAAPKFYVNLMRRSSLNFPRNGFVFSAGQFRARASGVCENAPEKSFTVSYLINTCGLPSEAAISASKKICFDSPEKPDAVLDLLRKYGFTDALIPRIVTRWPKVLVASPVNTLLPKLEFFRSIGVPGPVLAQKISMYPFVLTQSLENSIIPSYNDLKLLLRSDKRVVHVFTRSIRWPAENAIRYKISLLSTRGVPESSIVYLVTRKPNFIITGNEKFAALIDRVVGMGFDSSQTRFVNAIQVLLELTESNLRRKREVYRKCGWSESDMDDAFLRYPLCMNISEKKIIANMDFLVNTMGCKPSGIAQYPVLLTYSLSKRIKPRCLVARVLNEKRLKKMDTVATILVKSEKHFLKNYIVKYEKDVPGLLDIYRGKLSPPLKMDSSLYK